MSRRRLSDEERAVWDGVVRSVTPLRKSGKTAAPAGVGGNETSPPRRAPTRHESPQPAKPLPLASFDRRTRRRIARGRDAIDDRIDLHGMTQQRAHAALSGFLRRAQAGGARIVLVVTGKGSGKGGGKTGTDGGGRGVLRRQVPLWLSLPEFRPLIVGFEEAHVGHGGEGALYVRLRRIR